MSRFQFSLPELLWIITLAACLLAELAAGTEAAREELLRVSGQDEGNRLSWPK